MVPNIDGTMGHKIKPEDTQGMEHSTLFSIQQKYRAQSLKEMQYLGLYLYNSLPKYLRVIESVKTEKFKFELD